jgi:integrase/recombinase XerD
MNQPTYQAYDRNGARKYLNSKENYLFLERVKCLSHREKLLCQTLYFTGCRPCELIRFTKANLDVSSQAILIECAKKRGKTLIRRLPVPESLINELLALEEQDGRLWAISRFEVWRIIREVMETSGIQGIQACPKGLRHSFGVRAAMSNVPLFQIQRWMGHSSITTTSIYLDVKDEEERDLMARTWE